MPKITLHHSGPLGLPGGTKLRPGVATEVPNWNILKNHNTVKAWIKAGLLVEGEAKVAAAKSSTDGGNAPEGGASTSGDDQSGAGAGDGSQTGEGEGAGAGGSSSNSGEPDIDALKAEAKTLGIKFTWNTKPETLIEKIAEAKAAK